jgi:U3 small nucleolar RNA-associated protein 13
MTNEEKDDGRRSEESDSSASSSPSHGDDNHEEGFSDVDHDDSVAADAADDEQKLKILPAGLLSKSWSVASAHVPTFTGGKVTPSFFVEKEKDENEASHTTHSEHKPFLLLPVHGDVAVVDAEKGVKWGTVRMGVDKNHGSALVVASNEEDVDDDDDDGVDHDDITSYALDHRNHSIVTCSRNNLLRQYAVSYNESVGGEPQPCSTKLVHTWGRSGHTLPVTQLAFHLSNVFLATGSVDGTVRIWDVRGRYVTHVFRPLSGGEGGGSGRLSVTSVAWKPKIDELVVAIGRDDGSMVIHDLRDKDNLDHVVILRDHVSAVTCMNWWGEEFFVSTGRDAILNLWRVVEENNVDDKHSKKDKKTKKKAKGIYDAVMGHRPTIVYRRIQTIPVYEQVEGMVLLPSSPDQLGIVTAGSKGTLRVWSARVTPGHTPQLKQTLEQPASQVFGEGRGGYLGLALNHSAIAEQSMDELLIAVDAEHNLSFVDSKLSLNRTIIGHNDEILDLKIIPNQHSAVVATNSPQVRVFDLENFSCSVLDGHTATVLCVDASPCGRYLASCGKDKTLRLWKADTHECVGIATGHTEPIGACGLSRKLGKYEVGGKAARNGGGAFCVTASIDRTLKRWNLLGPDEWDSDKPPVELVAATSIRGHEKDINIVTIAPNDSLVASGSQDKTVKLWNATDLSIKATLRGHRRGVWDCQFSPIDRVLATSSGDKSIKLWSLSDYSCVRTFQGHLSGVLRIRFLSTGLQLLSSGADGLIKLWTIRTNECEATLDAHSDKIWALDLACNADASNSSKDLLVSGGADSKIVLWQDTTAQLEAEERAQQAEGILLEQQMVNHLRHKEFDKALEIALKVDKPMQAYKVLTALLESEISSKKKRDPSSRSSVLRTHVATWELDRVAQVLKYCRDWNTRARNAPLAMWVVQAIVTTIPVDRLSCQAATRTEHGSIPELLAGITPYAERHFERLDRLHTSAYLLDYLLFNMSSFDPMGVDVDENEFARWEAKSKLVLPPKFVDGRIQVGGRALIGVSERGLKRNDDGSDVGSDDDDDENEVLTVGDSSTASSESDNDDDMSLDEKLNGQKANQDDSSNDSSSNSDD